MAVIIPLYEPDREWRMWHMPDIYTGPNGTGRIVPNPMDLILDYATGFHRCVSIDLNSLLSTLEHWTPPTGGGEESDLLLGSGPGAISESYRLCIDYSVTPAVCDLDVRLRTYSSNASFIRIFKGTDISPSGEIISAMYSQAGQYINEKVPLELVTGINPSNYAVKRPVSSFTNKQLEDGELVTAVVYGQNNTAISSWKLLVKRTAFTRGANSSIEYVTGIRLKTPFLSQSDPKRLEVPLNMNLAALNLYGVVSYSSGNEVELPVDGSKFELAGMDSYVSSILGQVFPLVLTYKLSPGEQSFDLAEASNGRVTEAYTGYTVDAVGAYTLKLFGLPSWKSALNEYRMEYYLQTLDREKTYYATPYVTAASNANPFDPNLYGTIQNLAVAVDVDQVSSDFMPYRHVQTLDVTLLAIGGVTNTTNWTVGFAPGQSPAYGVNLRATAQFQNVNLWRLNLSAGLASQEEWLNKLYYAGLPMVNLGPETVAPLPTHVLCLFKNSTVEVPVTQWSDLHTVANDLGDGETLFLRWIRRTMTGDMELAVTGIVLNHTT